MSIEVEVTGNGKFAGHSTNLESYTVVEEATPIDPADSSGQTGAISFVATEDPAADGTILLLNDDIRLTDTKAGETNGRVNTVSVNGIAATVSGDSRLALLNANGFVPPYKGDLEGAVLAILALAGIDSGIVITPAVSSIPVAHRGGTFNYWLLLKEMCQATGLAEVSLVSGNVVVREIRGREAVTDRIGQRSWSVSNVDLAQFVEVKYWNYVEVTNGLVFPYGGWTSETPIFGTSIGAGETQVINIPVDVSLTSIQQPTVQDFVAREYSGPNSVYAVTGSDNLPVTAAQWSAQGGSITLAIGADGQSIDMTVTGASEAQYAPYQIAVSAGPSNYYSSLRVIGSGLGFTEKMVRVPTGAPAEKTAQEVGITIDNPWIDTYPDAMSAALRAAAGYAAPRQTVNITASVINRGDNGSYAYPTFIDFADQYPTEDFAAWDAIWSGETFADFNDYQFSLVRDDFANQVFGNAAGARLPFRDAMYRIKSANITQDGVVNATGERDTTFDDFNEAQGENTGWLPTGPDVTNLFTNPSFEAAGSSVEVWRNLYRYTNAETGATTGWTARNSAVISSSTEQAHTGTRSYKVVTPGAVPDEGISTSPTANAVSSGVAAAETHSVWVYAPSGALMSAVIEEYTTAAAFVASRGTTDFVGTGTWQRVSVTGTKATAANVIRILVRSRAGVTQAITFYVDDLSATATPVFVWDPTDPDLTLSYVGTVNASESLLSGVGVPGVTGVNCAAIRSSQWAKEGTYSLRLIPTGTSNNSYVYFQIPNTGSLRTLGTLVGTIRLAAPQTGTTWARARSTEGTAPIQTGTQAPNTAGDFESRVQFASLTGTYQARLTNGASIGNGDVWWDLVGLFEGVYDGPGFSGSTSSDPGPGYAYEWDGTINNSTSTRTELELGTGPTTFADFNARFDGYRFEDFALIPLAFSDLITPYGG